MATATTGNKASSMPKALSIAGMVVAALVLLIFALDMFTNIPFHGASWYGYMNIGFIVCALALGYLSWSAYRDVR